MKFCKLLGAILVMGLSLNVYAGFGDQKSVENASVGRVFQGAGAAFVTFLDVSMPECSGNGGYLQPSWDTANGGTVNDAAANRMMSVILSSKAIGTKMQVRYRVNDAGTGWNNCVISGLYLY